MAIQFRSGIYSDYDASKMSSAEPAVVLSGDPNTSDGKSVRVGFGSGTDKRLLTEDDLDTFMGRLSHVGMVIHSTTLDTMAKVIAQYGGTTWIQHSGYFLYGATTNVTANNATSDGGESTHTLTVDEMPNHTHTSNAAYTNYGSGGNTGSVMLWGDGTASVGYTGGGQAHNNMPPYKNVYIWERTA